MHDEQLERRLRRELREDARQLPFTITAAELERRLAARDRSLGGRRLGLLLAAAVGIGLFGIGGAMGGLFDDPTPSLPAPSPVAEASGPVPTTPPSAPRTLPSLDDMLADGDPATVVLAQSHGPAAGPDPAPAGVVVDASSVNLGAIVGSTELEVSVACLGASGIRFSVGAGIVGGFNPGLGIDCDGSVRTVPVAAGGGKDVWLTATKPASWRIVIREVVGTGTSGPGDPEPPILEAADGDEELVRLENRTVEPSGPGSIDGDLVREDVGALPGRHGYTVQLWCVDGDSIRYIHGDEIDGAFVARTTTQVECDGFVHRIVLSIPEPFGSRVYIAADRETRWSVVVSGEQPPVALVRELPGWQLSAGAGPDLAFDTGTQAFTGPGVEGGGPILIAVSCAGTGTIEVSVRLEHTTTGQVTEDSYAQFNARCEPDGATTSPSFATADAYVDVAYTTTAGTWVAVSILVPDPLPSQR